MVLAFCSSACLLLYFSVFGEKDYLLLGALSITLLESGALWFVAQSRVKDAKTLGSNLNKKKI